RGGQACDRALGSFLARTISRRDPLRAGVGLRRLDPADRAAHRVDLDPLAAVLTAQVLVEQALEPALSDHLAAPVAALLELLVAGLADVAEKVRREAARGIDPLGLDLRDDARQLELPLLDLRGFGQGQAAP